ncbi:MAG: tyrosine-type recombinase/integrase [Pseudomonadota bacterium]
MPIYKKRKGAWRVMICLNGKRMDFIVTGKKAEAKAFEARKRAELEAAGPSAMSTRTVPRFSDFSIGPYQATAKRELRPGTWRKVKSVVATLIEHFGHLKLNEIDAAAIDAYVDNRRARRDDGAEGLKAVSVNNELRILRRILNVAKEKKYPGGGGEHVKEIPQDPPGRVKVWDAKQIARLYEACEKKAPPLLPLLVFLANTGCRCGEALALVWENVDLTNRMIKIHPSEEWRPKNGRPREIPISDALLPWLARQRRSQKWVFPSPGTGSRWAFWPGHQWARVQEKATLEGGVHTLRHSFASAFLQERADMFLLAEVMGHSHTSVTALYSHLLPDHLEKARNVVQHAPQIGPAALEAKARWKREPAESLPGTLPEAASG